MSLFDLMSFGFPILDLIQSWQANQYGQEAFEGLQEQNLALQEQLGEIGDENRPSFIFNEEWYGPRDSPLEPINLNEIFDVGQATQNEFLRNIPYGPGEDRRGLPSAWTIPEVDFGAQAWGEGSLAALGEAGRTAQTQLGEAISGLGEGLLDPGTLFGRVRAEGVLPETDLSAVLSGRLAGVTRQSQAREQQRREELAATSARFGGLENLRRQQRSIGFEEAAERGRRGAFETAATRSEELAAQQFVSDLAGRMMTSEADINRFLRAQQARYRGAQAESTGQFAFLEQAVRNAMAQMGMSEQEINAAIQTGNVTREMGLAGTLSQLAGGAELDDVNALTAMLSNLHGYTGEDMGAASLMLNSILGMGQVAQPYLGFNQLLASSLLPYMNPSAFMPEQPDQGVNFNLGLSSIMGLPSPA